MAGGESVRTTPRLSRDYQPATSISVRIAGRSRFQPQARGDRKNSDRGRRRLLPNGLGDIVHDLLAFRVFEPVNLILHADGNVVTRSVSEGRKAFPRLRFGLQSNVSFVPTRTILTAWLCIRLEIGPLRAGRPRVGVVTNRRRGNHDALRPHGSFDHSPVVTAQAANRTSSSAKST